MLRRKTDESKRQKCRENAPQACISPMERPKVMVIDFEDDVVDGLKAIGLKVTKGTFGKRYSPSVDFERRARFSHEAPAIEEQDIVVVNIDEPVIEEEPQKAEAPSKAREYAYMIPTGQSYFNPRPFIGAGYRDCFERIYRAGGILVTFARREYSETYVVAQMKGGYPSEERELERTNYAWAPFNVWVNRQVSGYEVTPDAKAGIFTRLFERYRKDFFYEVSFSLDTDKYLPLARNKFGDVVSFARAHAVEGNQQRLLGWFLMLPATNNIPSILTFLFKEILPTLAPGLFPGVASLAWVDDESYLLPAVKSVVEERNRLHKEYKQKLQATDERIAHEKRKLEFLPGMLLPDAFDTKLVRNVAQCLRNVGYKDVVVLDDEIEGNPQEDIQIRDGGRLTLLEVKGLTGLPSEGDCQQILKYMIRRQKEENRTDVQGVFIVNHDRNLPPSQRHQEPFTGAQIEDAKNSSYSLVSTWDIYKAFAAFQRGELTFEDIDHALSTPGLVSFLPKSWCNIGGVMHLYPQASAVLINLSEGSIKLGQKIGYRSDDAYITEEVTSMQVDRENVTEATKGTQVSIRLSRLPPKKARIYKIAGDPEV